MLVRIVDQHRELFGADFLGSVAKDKEQGIDDIGFAAAIGADNAGKTLHTEGENHPQREINPAQSPSLILFMCVRV